MLISKSKRCFNVKSSAYYFHLKTKALADFQICISVPFIRLMTYCVKLRRAVSFMKHLASVFFSIFLPKTLICSKVTFWPSKSVNLAELVVNDLTKRISKKKLSISLSELSLLIVKISRAYNKRTR